MTSVTPFIKCVDYWPTKIPPPCLQAYRELIAEGQIRNHNYIYNERTHAVTIEYYAIMPHEWVLEELKKRKDGNADYGKEADAGTKG